MSNARKGSRRDPAAAIPPEYTDELAAISPGAEVIEHPTLTTANVIEEREKGFRARRYRGQEVFNVPPVEWLIHKWLPARATGAIYGPPGHGKSHFALHLAMEMARGGSWLGEKLEPRTVVYLAAEAPEVIRERLEAWTLHYRETIPDTFYLDTYSPHILKDDWHTVKPLLAEVEPSLVIIDTLASVTPGADEKDGTEWTLLTSRMRELVREAGGSQCTVLAVHHTPVNDPTRLRGHGSLLGDVDITVLLLKEGDYFTAEVKKMRAGKEPPKETYRLEPVSLSPDERGRDRDGVVMLHTYARTVTDTRQYELLERIYRDYATVGIRKKEAVDEMGWNEKTTERALTSLRKAGYLELRGYLWHLTEKGRAAYTES